MSNVYAIHDRITPLAKVESPAVVRALVGSTGKLGASPERVRAAALYLLKGATRLRRNADGIYGDVPAVPVTKPIEALAAWADDLSGDSAAHRAEIFELFQASAEEVDAAATACGDAERAKRLRDALFQDAQTVLGDDKPERTFLSRVIHHPSTPWVAVSILGGIVIGMLLQRSQKASS